MSIHRKARIRFTLNRTKPLADTTPSPRPRVSIAGWSVAAIIFVTIFLLGKLFIDENPTPQEVIVSDEPTIDLSPIMGWNDDYWYVNTPNLESVRISGVQTELGTGNRVPMDFTVSTNAAGLRDDPITPKDGRYRILAIGSSMTFGLGVNDDEAWPAVLERELRDAGYRVDVVNAGVIGHTAFQGDLYLAADGLALDPDLVLASYGHNAGLSWDGFSDPERETWGFPEGRWRTQERVDIQDQRKREMAADDTKQYPRLNHDEYVAALHAIARTTREAGAEIVFLAWPIQYDFTRGQPPTVDGPAGDRAWTYFDSTFKAARTVDVPVFDVLGAVDRDEAVLMDIVHLNARGYRLVGERLARWLIERGYLDGYHASSRPAHPAPIVEEAAS